MVRHIVAASLVACVTLTACSSQVDPEPIELTPTAVDILQPMLDEFGASWEEVLESDFRPEVEVIVTSSASNMPVGATADGFDPQGAFLVYEHLAVESIEPPFGVILVPSGADVVELAASNDLLDRMRVAVLMAVFYADHVTTELSWADLTADGQASEVVHACLAGTTLYGHMGSDIMSEGHFTNEKVADALAFVTNHRPLFTNDTTTVGALMGGFGTTLANWRQCIDA